MAAPIDPPRRKKADKPKAPKKTRQCPACLTVYEQIRKNFGHGKYCVTCQPLQRNRPHKHKTCPACGVTYFGVVANFKRKGRLRDTCNKCGEA